MKTAYDRLGENTRSSAVDTACAFTHEMIENLERAIEHPDMSEDLAEILSTQVIEVEYETKIGITVQ